MEAHQKRILGYCEEDVNATVWLGRQMLPELDIEQALWRGKYCKSNAYFEHNGVPIDLARFRAIENESPKLKLSMANKIEETHRYGVYVTQGKETTTKKPTPVFKMAKCHELLDSKGITVGDKGAMWQSTPSGDPMLEDEYFGGMCNVYPELQPLRQCQKSLNSLSRFGTVVGEDGFNRATQGCSERLHHATIRRLRTFFLAGRTGFAT